MVISSFLVGVLSFGEEFIRIIPCDPQSRNSFICFIMNIYSKWYLNNYDYILFKPKEHQLNFTIMKKGVNDKINSYLELNKTLNYKNKRFYLDKKIILGYLIQWNIIQRNKKIEYFINFNIFLEDHF
jgi:hypothetical protein